MQGDAGLASFEYVWKKDTSKRPIGRLTCSLVTGRHWQQDWHSTTSEDDSKVEDLKPTLIYANKVEAAASVLLNGSRYICPSYTGYVTSTSGQTVSVDLSFFSLASRTGVLPKKWHNHSDELVASLFLDGHNEPIEEINIRRRCSENPVRLGYLLDAKNREVRLTWENLEETGYYKMMTDFPRLRVDSLSSIRVVLSSCILAENKRGRLLEKVEIDDIADARAKEEAGRYATTRLSHTLELTGSTEASKASKNRPQTVPTVLDMTPIAEFIFYYKSKDMLEALDIRQHRDFARMTDAERNVPLLNPGFLSDNDTKAGLADADESEEDVSEEDVSEEYESTPPMPARRAVKAPQSTPRSTKQASLHYMGQHQGSSSGHAAKGRAQADGQHLDLTSRSAPVGNTKVRRWSSRRSSTSSSGSSLPDLTQIFAGKGAGADGAKRRKPTSGEMGNSGMDASTDEERTMQVESRPIASSSASPRRPRAASPSSTPFEAHSIVRRKPQPASARRVPAQSVSTRPGPSNARDATLLNAMPAADVDGILAKLFTDVRQPIPANSRSILIDIGLYGTIEEFIASQADLDEDMRDFLASEAYDTLRASGWPLLTVLKLFRMLKMSPPDRKPSRDSLE